jgi:DNA gyrase subunit A
LAVNTLRNFEPGGYLVMATVKGVIKKTPIEQFEKVRSTGIRAIIVREGDDLAWVNVSSGNDEIVIATAMGRIGRFNEDEVRPMGRDAAGVAGIKLAKAGDRVVVMSVVKPNSQILVLTETGYGKRARVDDVRKTHRGAQGVTLISLEGKKTGRVAAVELVPEDAEELMLISSAGQIVRTDLATIPVYGRAARGVIVMRLNEGDEVAGIAVFRADEPESVETAPSDEPPAG